MHHKLSAFIIVAAALSLIAVVSFNYIVDPYGVFRSSFIREQAINERFRKLDFLLNHPKDYNALLLGSSIVGLYNPENVNQIFKNKYRFYNLSFLGGKPEESYNSIKALLQNGAEIKKVIVGIDMFPFTEIGGKESQFDHPHPTISGESKWQFYMTYLFASSFYQGMLKLIPSFQKIPDIVFFSEKDGHYELPRYDEEIRLNQKDFIKEHLKNSNFSPRKTVWLQERFDQLKALVNLLESSGIETTYIIHPFSHIMTDGQPASTLETFRSKIKEIIPDVYDFSDYHQITDNDCLYYDYKHYRPLVADKLLKAIFENDRGPASISFSTENNGCNFR